MCERERERSLSPHCNRRRVWRRRKREVVASTFSCHCIPLTHSLFCSLWAARGFSHSMGFPRYTVCTVITHCFVHCDFVLASYIRLWPNELVDPFLTRIINLFLFTYITISDSAFPPVLPLLTGASLCVHNESGGSA